MTNFERIKGMSVEELADYIHGVSEGTKPCVKCDMDCDFCELSDEECKEKIKEWLESECDAE